MVEYFHVFFRKFLLLIDSGHFFRTNSSYSGEIVLLLLDNWKDWKAVY